MTVLCYWIAFFLKNPDPPRLVSCFFPYSHQGNEERYNERRYRRG